MRDDPDRQRDQRRPLVADAQIHVQEDDTKEAGQKDPEPIDRLEELSG